MSFELDIEALVIAIFAFILGYFLGIRLEGNAQLIPLAIVLLIPQGRVVTKATELGGTSARRWSYFILNASIPLFFSLICAKLIGFI
ncbi:MAG: hypothetical protein JKY53_13285 [Flavobacteriales bacterium]|nr:hypothetical protein [Flavobacteriales bacterium]